MPRSPSPASLLKASSGRSLKGGLRLTLTHKQLLALTATVLLTGLITVPPSLATLNALSSSSPGQADAFASPTTPATATGDAAAAAAAAQSADLAVSAKGGSGPQQRGLASQQQQQTQTQQQQQKQGHKGVPVDVVYLWVNGSDPELQEELKRFGPAAPSAPQAVAASKSVGAALLRAAAASHKATAAAGTRAAAGGSGGGQQQQQQQLPTKGATRHLMAAQPDPAAAGNAAAATATAKAAPNSATAAAVKAAPNAAATTAPAAKTGQQPTTAAAKQGAPATAAAAANQATPAGATTAETTAARTTVAAPEAAKQATPAGAGAGAAKEATPAGATTAETTAAGTTVAAPEAAKQATPAGAGAANEATPAGATQTSALAAAQPAAAKPAAIALPVFKAAPGVMAHHTPTPQHQQQQQQQQKGATPAAPSKAAPPSPPKGKLLPLTELPTRQARFDAGRDELRYSLRSLEQHLPWYRHLYIVTNGQVPSWLDTSNPRLTLVPHASIFRNASHLPSFNSNAIQANLANIPGLSPHFIMMDDDLFLTAPWTHDDFLGPDGGQLTTGTALASGMSGTLPMYMKSIQRLVGVFQQRFGSWRRYLPAHAPHFLEVEWLHKMWRDLPGEHEQTSAAHLRTAKDVVIAAAYQWYISQFQPGQHPTASDSRSTFISLSNWIAKCYSIAAINDIRINPQHVKYRERVKRTAPTTLAVNAEATVGIAAALEDAAAGRPPRQYLVKQRANHTAELGKIFDTPGVKMVCLNDDIDDLYASVRPLINPTVVDFLAARYPTPSQYELPAGRVNGCSRRVKVPGFGHLPTAADIAAACGPPAAAARPQHGKRGHRKHGSQKQQQQQVAGVASA